MMGMLIGGIALGCGVVLYPFFSALLWGAILVFATWPAFTWLTRTARLPRAAAAALMVLLTAAILVLPLGVAIPGGAADARALRLSVETWLTAIPPAPHWLYDLPLIGGLLTDTWNAWAGDLSAMTNFFRPYFGLFVERGLILVLGFANGVAQLLVALFAAFFFWLSGETLAANIRHLVHRVAGRYAPQLIEATANTVRGAVYGILGTAILQGFLTAFGLAIAGVPRVVLLGTVAAFLAVLPIGAPLVWIPAGLWLLSDGHTARGIFMLAYGVIVVSGTDHIVRPYFIARGAKLPFLLTVLGVLGGVLAFGVLGIFLGPVLLGVGMTLVTEFIRADQDTNDAVGVPD
jgi:predicted PurR-regulated permease PerM